MLSLTDILAPVAVEPFLDNYWETQPLHVGRSNSGYFRGLVSTSDIEQIIAHRPLHFPNMQLIRADQPVEPGAYTTNSQKILPLRALQHHHDGATIALAHAHQHIAPLQELCNNVGQQLGVACQTNVYLSPGEAQGFKPHYDSHDVLILQVSGKKTFRFYAGGPTLPEDRHRFDSQHDQVGEQTSEVPLNAGDTLYIPRGWLHDAVSVGVEPSLHITMGLFAPTLADVVLETIEQARNSDVVWRQSLPGVSARNDSIDVVTMIRQALNALTQEQFQGAMQQLAVDAAIDSAPDLSGYLDRLAKSHNLHGRSSVNWRAGECLGLETHSERVILRSQGQVLEFGPDHLPALQHLITHEQCCIDSLPGLTDEQQLALCRTLVRQNLLDPN